MDFEVEGKVEGLRVNGKEVTGWRKYLLAVPMVLIGLGVGFLALAFAVALIAGVLALLALCG